MIDDRGKTYMEACVSLTKDGQFWTDVMILDVAKAEQDLDFIGVIGGHKGSFQPCEFKTLEAALRYSFLARKRGVTDHTQYIPRGVWDGYR